MDLEYENEMVLLTSWESLDKGLARYGTVAKSKRGNV